MSETCWKQQKTKEEDLCIKIKFAGQSIQKITSLNATYRQTGVTECVNASLQMQVSVMGKS